MSAVLAIDPGNAESAYVLIDEDCRPVEFGKVPNDELRIDVLPPLLNGLHNDRDRVAIEMVRSYGMPVGAEVFETVVWIGRLFERSLTWGHRPHLIYRGDVKVHHCHSAKAKDANVRQALIDRFGDKGTKSNPGWFYGFKADVWQAMALAVYVADTLEAS
jgi:hypothetical protein